MICLSTIQTLPVPPRRSPNPSIDRFRSQFRFKIKKLKSKSDGVPALAVSEFDNFLSVSMAAKDASSSSSSSVMLTSGASGRVTALFSPRVLRSFLLLVNAFLLLLLMPFRGRKDASSSSPSSSSSDKLKDEKKQKKQDGAGSSSISQSQRKGAVVRVPASVPWKSSATAAAAVDQEVASRRALAVQRVMEDGVQGKGDMFFRDFSLFATPGGKTMFTQSWTPVSAEVRGVVVVLHGLNEHGDRYSAFAKELNVNGYKVYAMDWIEIIISTPPKFVINLANCLDTLGCYKVEFSKFVLFGAGHGGSDGLHAYVHSLDEAVTDMKSFIAKVLAENPGLPCFCFGHSTGAAIILKSVLDPKIEACVAGIILTSPAVGVQPSHPIFAVLAPVFSFLFPRYQFSAANKQGMPVCRDPDALMAKYSDPLVYTGSIRVRTGYEILRITTYLQQNLTRVRVPFLVLHGASDMITDPEASKKLYEEASSTDKTIKLFDGLLHDLLFEPEREAIVNRIIDWLNRRI